MECLSDVRQFISQWQHKQVSCWSLSTTESQLQSGAMQKPAIPPQARSPSLSSDGILLSLGTKYRGLVCLTGAAAKRCRGNSTADNHFINV